MAAGFYGKKLKGLCHSGAPVCRPYDQLTFHVVADTKRIAGPIGEQSSCMTPGPASTPFGIIPASFTHGVVGYPYNTLRDEEEAMTMPHFHSTSHWLGQPDWNQRTQVFVGYPITYDGPALKTAHCAIGLKPRSIDNPFENRTGAYFTDAALPNQTNRNGDFLGSDWLGFLHPGGFMYVPADIPEPMLCESFLEDGGWVPSIPTNAPLHYNIMEFAKPLSVYQDLNQSTLLGQYVGLAFVPFFGECAIKNPIGPLPDDPSVPYPPGATLQATGHLVSLDLWIYMLAKPEPGKTLKSPRISTMRWWVPKANLTYNQNTSWCDKYMYLTFKANDAFQGTFSRSLKFMLATQHNNSLGASVVSKITLSNFKAYIVA